MNYQNKETLYHYFHSVIDAEVTAQLKALEEDIERLKYETQVSIENDLKEEQANTLKLAEAEMNRSYHLKLAAYQRELDVKIMKKRNVSIQELFHRLDDYLKQFIHTKDYVQWIENVLSNIDLKTITKIQIDPKDSYLIDKLKDFNDVIHVDGLIGGAIFFEDSLKKVIDVSFKNRLKEAESWFYSNVQWPTSGDLNE